MRLKEALSFEKWAPKWAQEQWEMGLFPKGIAHSSAPFL
jgi:hypothetical protein